MKHLISLSGFIIIGIIIFCSACKKEEQPVPQASTQVDFTYVVSNNGYAPCTVTFTNKSILAKAYVWDFGNGQSSTETSPVVTYDSVGIFSVTLTCSAENNVYYNKTKKTVGIIVKSPEAPAVNVLYFADRAAGKAKFVILNGQSPVVQEFTADGLGQVYGIAVDTTHRKVYITDYSGGSIFMANVDGTDMTKIVTTDLAIDGPYGIVAVGDKIYWTMQDALYSAGLDGSNPSIAVNFGGNIPKLPLDMKFDYNTQKFYFVNDRYDVANGGGLWSMNLDGSALTNIIPDLDGSAIDVDIPNSKLYFAAYAVAGTTITEDGLYMSNLDGTNIQKFGDFGSKATWGIAHDADAGKLYFGIRPSASGPDGKIMQANLDGGGQSDFITGINPYALTFAKVKL
ncbi:MAG: PKD domain-containing protein [Bacteroidota bacterium]